MQLLKFRHLMENCDKTMNKVAENRLRCNLRLCPMSDMSDLIIWAAAAIILAGYVATLSASIAGGDSGEIVAEGCHLGTAHPPGYPLITTIIYAISRIDVFGTVAHRINLFCAVCTTLAAVLIGRTVQTLQPSRSSAGAVLAMGLFAFSPLIWQYAITAEVFPLNTFFAALIVYLVVKFAEARSNIFIAYFGAFICGLALCNQHTIVLFEAPLILWMLFLLHNHILAQPRVFVILSVSFLAGLLPYAYLPIAATLSPKAGSWGQVDTLAGFLHHILRRDYGTFQLFSGEQGRNAEGFGARNAAFVADFVGMQVGLTDRKEWSAYGTIVLSVVVVGILLAGGNSLLSLLSSGGKARHTPPGARKTAASTPASSPAGKKTAIKGAATTGGTSVLLGSGTSSTSAAAVTDSKAVAAALALSPEECRHTPLVLVATLVFYFGVFHSLSNLPLRDRLLYGVHQRFWMQPNILMFTFLGVGVNAILHTAQSVLKRLLTASQGDKAAAQAGKSRQSGANPKKPTSNGGDSAHHAAAADGASAKTTLPQALLQAALWTATILAVLLQFRTWQPVLDMRENTHFAAYAKAVLSPLPPGAVLLVNYDQQWTSVRYLQICEGYRTDVTAMQLSMMTYPWFQHKRALYPNLNFPGTYHTYPGSVAQRQHGAFTLRQFLDANIPHYHIYLGGKLSYSDPQLDAHYEIVPEGMVSRFRPVSPLSPVSSVSTGVSSADASPLDYSDPSAAAYVRTLHHSWGRVAEAGLSVTTLPDPVQYPEETWEWTIGRDYRDRIIDTAALLLQKALEVEFTDPLPLVEALYWLESAYVLETLNVSTARQLRQRHNAPAEPTALHNSHHVLTTLTATVFDSSLFPTIGSEVNASSSAVSPSGSALAPEHLLKNAGLAYVHLIRSAGLAGDTLPLPQRDVLRTLETGLLQWPVAENYKIWTSNRFVFFWGAFLRHPQAQRDPQYPTILATYQAATEPGKTRAGGSKGKSGGEGKVAARVGN